MPHVLLLETNLDAAAELMTEFDGDRWVPVAFSCQVNRLLPLHDHEHENVGVSVAVFNALTIQLAGLGQDPPCPSHDAQAKCNVLPTAAVTSEFAQASLRLGFPPGKTG